MLGTMQDWEMRVSGLLDHAAREHSGREIVSRWADGSTTRTDWQGIRRDALKMVQALRRLEIYPEDRVATLAMNHARHLVAWFGSTGAGCVLHTINPRLFDDQLDYIVNDARDRVLIYDAAFQPIVDRMKPRWPTIEHYICFDAGEHAASFEDWIGVEDGHAFWTPGDERQPCMLCYTSGTTGHPKGVLYSHRSNVLHALTVVAPSCMGLEPRSCVLPAVPMFHANNWGLPWASAATGAKMVYSQVNDPAALCALMSSEKVSHVGGVPTVWFSLFQHLDETDGTMPPIRVALSGGSAVPPAVVERLMRAGVRVMQAWGMTETSPIATVTWEPAEWDDMSFEEQVAYKSRQGRTLYGSEVRVVSLDDPVVELAHDGITSGALHVRGPWTIRRYFGETDDAVGRGQWFDTGDVATILPDRTLRLTDRTKDVIKSGGEWISSVELENAAVSHPDVLEAAAIGVPHPRWDERPLLIVVRRPGAALSQEDLRTYLEPSVPKWWLPEAVEFVDAIPHTGTGKISKKDLRVRFRDYRLPA
ncbi:long-chain fatty acid--CoA ligase [Novosphingobium mangrovi (ex Huang et al. 2023)]|uniref:Long-chain fatty acid--CoA ligase n=1 Tax=Novosphingobium mangrovi (ex Huang et al. 2023) TaxID=2976432 RepID=A0ABT2I773_9SPHN|nr:long-chain fatty acid--CoA ligase [Novosphingobium mangrovi (ex Huang et al. 2023)]MCT2400668.1 long-chain fatty acid--CoA ligase [Novosphingobium mangrovi (ex Huang et al. 2023)]